MKKISNFLVVFYCFSFFFFQTIFAGTVVEKFKIEGIRTIASTKALQSELVKKVDIKILDLSAMNKRLTDLVTDLGLGKVKKTKNGLELNPAQIEGIKAYLADRGYAGIRYEPRDTGRPNAPADEIAIFDNNSANRIVGSDASVPPSATPEAPKT